MCCPSGLNATDVTPPGCRTLWKGPQLDTRQSCTVPAAVLVASSCDVELHAPVSAQMTATVPVVRGIGVLRPVAGAIQSMLTSGF
jgi:hypothetical protein